MFLDVLFKACQTIIIRLQRDFWYKSVIWSCQSMNPEDEKYSWPKKLWYCISSFGGHLIGGLETPKNKFQIYRHINNTAQASLKFIWLMSADEKSRVKNLADDNFLTMEKQVWRSKKNKAMRTMDRLQLDGELCPCWQSTMWAIFHITRTRICSLVNKHLFSLFCVLFFYGTGHRITIEGPLRWVYLCPNITNIRPGLWKLSSYGFGGTQLEILLDPFKLLVKPPVFLHQECNAD